MNIKEIETTRLKELELKLSQSKGETRRDIHRSIWKIKNAEKNREGKKKYYQRNRKKVIKKQLVYQQKYRNKNPDIYNAYKKVNRIKVIGICPICRKRKATQKHHKDYSKPLIFQICCNVCHAKLDKLRRINNTHKLGSVLLGGVLYATVLHGFVYFVYFI